MSAPLSERPFAFASDGRTLRGMLGAPQAGPPPLGVVLIHGWSGTRIGPHRMLVDMARRLVAAGMATLRFDLRGRGDSEGDAAKSDLDGMIEDTLYAAAYLERETGAERVALLGICSGANVALGAASVRPDIHALALWSALPFQPDRRAAQRRRRWWHYLKQYAQKALNWRTWARLARGEVNVKMAGRVVAGEASKPPGEDNPKDSARDIMKDLSSYPGRMLFVTGTLDPDGMAGREVFRSFCRAHACDARFELIEGANHSYYDAAHAERVMGLTLRWLTGA
jgi:dienelactone hydrolase